MTKLFFKILSLKWHQNKLLRDSLVMFIEYDMHHCIVLTVEPNVLHVVCNEKKQLNRFYVHGLKISPLMQRICEFNTNQQIYSFS